MRWGWQHDTAAWGFERSLVGVAGILGGCALFSGNSYRFKMTVVVETPQGLKTGSSVMQVTAYKTAALTPEEKQGGGGLSGQAVVVDLPDGPLFVLLKMPRGGDGLGAAVTLALLPETLRGNVDAYVTAVKTLGGWFADYKAELPRKDWPMMVRFRNINDPKSVEKLDPKAVGVKRILVETTNDPITIDIEKRMPDWFGRLIRDRVQFSGKPSNIIMSNDLADNLGPGDFGTEIGK